MNIMELLNQNGEPKSGELWDRIFAVLLAIVLLWGFWWFPGSPWIISQDNPTHFSKIAGAIDNGFFAFEHAWHPSLNGGRMLFHCYPYLAAKITQLIALILPLERAHNLVIFLAWLCCPLSVWYYMRRRGEAQAGVLAFVFLLLEPGYWLSGGFHQAVITGIVTNSAASGLLVLSIFRAERFVENSDGKRFAKLAILSALLLLTHTNCFYVFAAALPWFASRLKTWQSRIALLGGLPVITLSLAGPIWIGLLVRHFQGYWLDILKSTYAGTNEFTPALFYETFVQNMRPLFLIITLPALVYCLGMRLKSYRGFAVIFTVVTITILFNWIMPREYYNKTPLASSVHITRLFSEWRTCLLAGLALAIVHAGQHWIKDRKYRAAIIGALIIFCMIYFFQGLSVRMKSVTRLTPKNRLIFEKMWEPLRNGEGRVLHQTMYQRTQDMEGRTHMDAAMPFFNGRDVITFDGSAYSQTEIGSRDFLDYFYQHFKGPDLGKNWCEQMNITNIIVLQQNRFVFRELAFPLYQVGNWIVMKTTIEPSYVSATAGEIKNVSFSQLNGMAEIVLEQDGPVQIKINDYPNWKVTIDGKHAVKLNRPGAFIEVAAPAGNHQLHWRFRLTWTEWLGYLIFLISILSCSFLMLNPPRKII